MAKRRTMKKRSMKRKTMKRRQRGGQNITSMNVPAAPVNNTQKKGFLNALTNTAGNVAKTVTNTVGLTSNVPLAGGKKKTRKASPWAKAVGKLYHEMQRKDKSVTFVKALKEASRLKKAGKFNY